MKEDNRIIVFDIFRIILMFMVLVHHTIVHGFSLTNLKNGFLCVNNATILFLLNSFCIVAVNCFFLLSGYFRIKHPVKKIIKISFECILSIAIWQFFLLLVNRQSVDLEYLLFFAKRIVSFYSSHWYIETYLILLLISPLINMILEKENNKFTLYFSIAFLLIDVVIGFYFKNKIIGNGYTLFHCVTMYILGNIIKSLKDNFFSDNYFLLSYIIISLIIFFVSKHILYDKGKIIESWHFFSYNNPFIIVSSIFLFMSFIDKTIENKTLRKISYLSKYSIFIITFGDYYSAYDILWKPIHNFADKNSSLLVLIIYPIILFFVCVCIGAIIDKTYYDLERVIQNDSH